MLAEQQPGRGSVGHMQRITRRGSGSRGNTQPRAADRVRPRYPSPSPEPGQGTRLHSPARPKFAPVPAPLEKSDRKREIRILIKMAFRE